MGKFTSVQANSLLNAANQALSELNKHNLSNIKSSLNTKSVLTSGVSPKINKTITSITQNSTYNGNLSNLKKHLNNLKRAAELIIKCQSLEREIESLRRQLARTSSKDRSYANSLRRRISQKESSLRNYEFQVENILSR